MKKLTQNCIYFTNPCINRLVLPSVTLGAACWLWLGCWSNNAANSHPSPGTFKCKVQRVLRSCLVPQCSYPLHWPWHQRRLANCDWMPASYTNGQPSRPRRHPTCSASSQRIHTVSTTQCHGAWTPDPLSTHLSTECECTASQIETPICTHRTTTPHFLWQQWHTCGALGWSPMGTGSVWTTLQDSALSSPTPTPTLLDWHFQEQRGSGLTASAPVSRRFRSWLHKRVWPALRPVSVAQKNRTSAILSSSVQPIDVPMDFTAWRFWKMRQLNCCSTPAPRF